VGIEGMGEQMGVEDMGEQMGVEDMGVPGIGHEEANNMGQQLALFTPGGKIFSLEAYTAELRIKVLDHLCKVYHDFNDGKPLDIDEVCKCGNKLSAFVQTLPNNGCFYCVVYCRECGWHREVRLPVREIKLSAKEASK